MMPLSTLMLASKKTYASFIVSDEYRFWCECLDNITKTPSQNFQDIWVLYETNYKKNGYFVEFGAADGISGSNTYLLEKVYGWKGILAEPNPEWHKELASNRTCDLDYRCVYLKTGETVEFSATDEPQLAAIKQYADKPDIHFERRTKRKEIQVRTITLMDMLENANSPSVIDYMSVDTEGSEYDIISNFFENNKNKYDVRQVTIEHNFDAEIREKMFALFTKQGYTRKFTNFSRWDDFYIKVDQ